MGKLGLEISDRDTFGSFFLPLGCVDMHIVAAAAALVEYAQKVSL